MVWREKTCLLVKDIRWMFWRDTGDIRPVFSAGL